MCHRARARNLVTGLPPVPTILQVQLGTTLTIAEIEFLSSKGLHFVGRSQVSGLSSHGVALRIDVDSYPERINMENTTDRLQFRNRNRIRHRSVITINHLQRIERAEQQEMIVISEQTVTEGNAFGMRFCVRTHENEDTPLYKEYWVQICCFPTCSCDDYWQHHWYKSSFLLCKHLYWILKNVFHLEIRTNLLIIQPVWTVAELKCVLDRYTLMV